MAFDQGDGTLQLGRRAGFFVPRMALLLGIVGLLVREVLRRAGNPDNAQMVAFAALFAAFVVFVELSQLLLKFDSVGIQRLLRRKIHWKDVVAVTGDSYLVLIATPTAVCEISMRQFKEPQRLLDFIRGHAPASALDKPVPRLWRVTKWR